MLRQGSCRPQGTRDLGTRLRQRTDRDGQARTPRRHVMSSRGNDLVRRYLWMAAYCGAWADLVAFSADVEAHGHMISVDALDP
jgi:hypothetical protein